MSAVITDSARLRSAMNAQGGGLRATAEERLLTSAITLVGRAPGGSNEVWEGRLDDGGTVFAKPLDGIDDALAASYGHSPESALVAEFAASRLAAELSEPYASLVVVTVLREIDGLGVAAVAEEVLGDPRHASHALQVGAPAVRRAAFFDALIGQLDRNAGNLLADPSGVMIRLIDHGYAFGRPGDLVNERAFDHGRGVGALEDPDRRACEAVLRSPDLFGLEPLLGERRATAMRVRARRMLMTDRLSPRGI